MSSTRYPTTDDPTPTYLTGSGPDELARMIVGLTEELWILRDRVMVLEQVLHDCGTLTGSTVDEHVPGVDLGTRLATERQRLIERVLGAPLNVDR